MLRSVSLLSKVALALILLGASSSCSVEYAPCEDSSFPVAISRDVALRRVLGIGSSIAAKLPLTVSKIRSRLSDSASAFSSSVWATSLAAVVFAALSRLSASVTAALASLKRSVAAISSKELP